MQMEGVPLASSGWRDAGNVLQAPHDGDFTGQNAMSAEVAKPCCSLSVPVTIIVTPLPASPPRLMWISSPLWAEELANQAR